MIIERTGETRIRMFGSMKPITVDFVQAMYPKCYVFGQDVKPKNGRLRCEVIIKKPKQS